MIKYLDNSKFNKPDFQIISNFTAINSSDSKIILNSLKSQMSNSVRWVESIKLLESLKVENIIEIGPNKVLTGLCKRISNNFSFYNINTVLDLKNIINEN